MMKSWSLSWVVLAINVLLPRDATHNAVMRLHVVCPSVCDVEV